MQYLGTIAPISKRLLPAAMTQRHDVVRRTSTNFPCLILIQVAPALDPPAARAPTVQAWICCPCRHSPGLLVDQRRAKGQLPQNGGASVMQGMALHYSHVRVLPLELPAAMTLASDIV